MPVPGIADRRHNPAGHQTADTDVVSRHASARPGQEGPTQHRAGPAARDLNQRCLARPAQADAGHCSSETVVTSSAPPAHGSRSTRLTSAASAPAKGPVAVAADTRLLSSRSRPPRTVGRCTPASRSCADLGPAKPNACAPVSRPEPRSSATAANGFAVSPSSRVSSTSATSLAPVAPLPATLPSAGRTRCSLTSRTASWPPTVWSAPNICPATSVPSLGASTAASSLKTIHERLAIAATTTPPMPYRFLKLAEHRW
jgi:hypothetical protein